MFIVVAHYTVTMLHVVCAVLKVLLQYSRNVGLDLGQAGYQAIASCCSQRKDGLQLLSKMKVWSHLSHPLKVKGSNVIALRQMRWSQIIM